MAHIIDKAFESLTGFIHVLPGAFSAYRWEALSQYEVEGQSEKVSILDDYLKTITIKDYQAKSLEEANMYLAEDRILCLKIYCRYGKSYKLSFIPSAKSVVDPVTHLIGLLGQRRRWINGSWYALDYVLDNYKI